MKSSLQTLISFSVIGFALLFGGAATAVTPTANELSKLLASDGEAFDNFGLLVAIDGDTAMIGARGDDDNGVNSGSAYVFTRISGVWTEQSKLLPRDGAAGDYFGSGIAIDGDTAVIGAYRGDAAYVFTRISGVWTEQQKLTAGDDGAADDWFGISVAIDGDTAVIGAIFDDDNGVNSGSAYVFTRISGVWTEQSKLLPRDGAADDYFGRSVAIEEDTAFVGADRDGDNGRWSGSAYVFTRISGVWTEQQKLTAGDDGAAFNAFGTSVAIDGDTAVIGSGGYSFEPSSGYFGSAYVFTRISGVWTEQQKLLASDGAAGDLFGGSVAIDGDTAVIGAGGDDDNGDKSGSAYVFTRSGDVWTESLKLLASDGAVLDLFGLRVAISGSTAIVGALRHATDGKTEAGAAYVFALTGVDVDTQPIRAINLKSKGVIPVAILGSGMFDALQVDPSTVVFGPDGAKESHGRGHADDVNGDGIPDFVGHFKTQETGIECGDTEAPLTGETYFGVSFSSTVIIERTVGCR